jgi:hypothetical protein
VLVCAVLFAFSMLAGTRRGLIRRVWQQSRLAARVSRQHVLLAMYEFIEAGRQVPVGEHEADTLLMNAHQLAATRHWTLEKLDVLLRKAARDGDVILDGWPIIRLTGQGLRHAKTVVRNHRLWEWYLIRHADIAASHVDRAADEIEHVLGAAMVAELEDSLDARNRTEQLARSPHRIELPTANSGEVSP